MNCIRDIWHIYHSWYFQIAQISLAQRLVKLCKTILKYRSWYLCQISLQIMLLPMLIMSAKLLNADWSMKREFFFLILLCEEGKITRSRLVLSLPSNSLSKSLRSKRSCSKEELPNDFRLTGRAKVGSRDWGNTCKKTPYFWKTPTFLDTRWLTSY